MGVFGVDTCLARAEILLLWDRLTSLALCHSVFEDVDGFFVAACLSDIDKFFKGSATFGWIGAGFK